jgi:putative methionine-R-sulfoxide reductase with GAF domain
MLRKIYFIQVYRGKVKMTAKKGSEDAKVKAQIKRLLTSIEASGHAILPHSNDDLLKSIVEAAGRIFNAAAASILLVNEKEQVLEFKVAYGASNHDLVGVKFPMGKGIAGYVVMTGQPLAISNVRQDARFNQDFAKSTGYVPNSILAMPMLSGDRVIGVMEVLDKIDAASFGIQDMDLLGMFAHQAAIAIDQSQRMEHIEDALVAGLKKIITNEPEMGSTDLISILGQTNDVNSSSDLIGLAAMFYEISELGDEERKVCLQVLKVFADYQRSKRRIQHGR